MSSLCWLRTYHGPHKAIFPRTHTHAHTSSLWAAPWRNQTEEMISLQLTKCGILVSFCPARVGLISTGKRRLPQTTAKVPPVVPVSTETVTAQQRRPLIHAERSENKRRKTFIVNGFAQNTSQEYCVDDACVRFIQRQPSFNCLNTFKMHHKMALERLSSCQLQ